nr:MAG: nonstructural protein [Microvirus sp.]
MFGKTSDRQVDLEVFAVYDSKTSSYGSPILATNHHDLIRETLNMFQDPEQQKSNKLFLNAEDFSIFRVGTYDKRKGELQGCTAEHITNMHDLRALVKQPGIVPT